jgi:hypothetical protein
MPPRLACLRSDTNLSQPQSAHRSRIRALKRGFDFLLKKYAKYHGGPPHLVVSRGAQWSRDSKRDYKVVGGKLIERTEDDPDDEEDGVG